MNKQKNYIRKNLNDNQRYNNENGNQANEYIYFKNEKDKKLLDNDKEIYRNDSFDIKNNRIKINNINEEQRKSNHNDINDINEIDNDLNVSIQSLSDSKVLEIANTYIDDQVDKAQITDILNHKKMQNHNSYYGY